MTKLANAVLIGTLCLLSTQYTTAQIPTTLTDLLPGANNPAAAAPSSSSGCGSNEPCTGDTPLTPAQVYALCAQNNQNQEYTVDQCPSNYESPAANPPEPTYTGTYSTYPSATLPVTLPVNVSAIVANLTAALTTITSTVTSSSTGASQATTASSATSIVMTKHTVLSVAAGLIAIGAYLL